MVDAMNRHGGLPLPSWCPPGKRGTQASRSASSGSSAAGFGPPPKKTLTVALYYPGAARERTTAIFLTASFLLEPELSHPCAAGLQLALKKRLWAEERICVYKYISQKKKKKGLRSSKERRCAHEHMDACVRIKKKIRGMMMVMMMN